MENIWICIESLVSLSKLGYILITLGFIVLFFVLARSWITTTSTCRCKKSQKNLLIINGEEFLKCSKCGNLFKVLGQVQRSLHLDRFPIEMIDQFVLDTLHGQPEQM